VIDSVWKSEIFVGAGNFTFMACRYPQYSTDRKQGAERNGGGISEATGWITGGIAGDQR
jgi:hypothetical protein